ncbi:hypothetical protein [Microcoleus sp. D3_18a_C4]|uniref:hypothetical protein n=1 Tax=Microcoleus sp. D3_18a_C4 TaxID=3055332 RepID=UPI002FD1984B
MVQQPDWTNFSLQRPNYFSGQYLLDEDFELGHKYLSDRQRYINSRLHLAGIVEGLEVEEIAGKSEVTIKSGTAIDGEGNLIILPEATSRKITTKVWLCLRYHQESDVLQQLEIPDSFTRIAEIPELTLEAIETRDNKTVILAQVTPEKGQVTINTEVRKYSGVRLPSSKTEGIAIRSNGEALAIAGNLHLGGNLHLAGTLQLSDRSSLTAVSEVIDVQRDRTTVVPSEKAVKDRINQEITDRLAKLNRQIEEEKQNRKEPVITGMIIMWSGSIANIPSGWALCDGENNTPNLKGRFIVGAGGTYDVGETGGSKEVTLTIDQIPSHNHDAGEFKQLLQKHPDGRNSYSGKDDRTVGEPNLKNADEIQPAGGGMPHENRPPYYALAYIMKL